MSLSEERDATCQMLLYSLHQAAVHMVSDIFHRSLVRPVRGCCLSTGYTLVPPAGKKGKNIFSNFIAFTVGVGKFLIRTIFFVDAG